MIRTATRGIVAFVLAVVFVLGSLFLVPDAARAVEPPPGPVTPFAELPSRLAGMWQSFVGAAPSTATPANLTDYNPSVHGNLSTYPVGSIGYQEEAAKMEAYLTSKGYPNPTAKLPSAVTAAKPSVSLAGKTPLTLPGVASRAAGGAVGIAGLVGFGVGTGGLALYSVATGTDAWAGMCGTAPGLETALADIQKNVNFGMGPACMAPVPSPNSDQTPMLLLEASGFPSVHKGLHLANYFGQPGDCVVMAKTPAKPSGYNVEHVNSSGVWSSPSQPGANSTNSTCGYASGAMYTHIWQPAVTALRWRNPTTGHIINGENVSPNPTRTLGCRIDWKDGTSTTTAGTTYNESGGVPLSVQALGCADAWASKNGGSSALVGAGRIRVTSNDGSTTSTLLDQPVSASTAEQQAMMTATATGGLVLTLTVAGVTDSCMTWAANCAGWWAETENGTVATHGTRTFTCSFNGATVSLGECMVYKSTFDVRTATPAVTDPVTGTSTAWIPAAGSTTPGNSGDPGTLPNGSTDPTADCMDQWSSVPDPIGWVLHPVKCALVWGFVPRSTVVQANVDAVDGAWSETWPVKGMEAMTTVLGVIPEASGCLGPRVHFVLTWPADIEFDEHPLSACEEPFATLATFGRLVGAFLLIGYTAWGVTRRIGAVVNAPGVGPSS